MTTAAINAPTDATRATMPALGGGAGGGGAIVESTGSVVSRLVVLVALLSLAVASPRRHLGRVILPESVPCCQQEPLSG
jgi:hypothetical protein